MLCTLSLAHLANANALWKKCDLAKLVGCTVWCDECVTTSSTKTAILWAENANENVRKDTQSKANIFNFYSLEFWMDIL